MTTGTGPSASQIRSAKVKAVGGGRKRCRKGKNCSAACIAGNKYCLVDLPEPVAAAMPKVTKMIQARQGGALAGSPASGDPHAKELTGVAAIQKVADDARLKKLENTAEEYKKRWADTVGKGDAEATKKAWDTYQFVKKEYDEFKTEHEGKYFKASGSSGVKATRGLTSEQEERIQTAARMTDYRIDKRLNERQVYDDATNAKIKAANEQVVAPFQKMSADEKAALSLYGQDGVKFYAQVNSLLRNGYFEGSTPEKKQMAEFISGNLRSGLEKVPPAKVAELDRAVSGGFASSLGKLKPGDVIEDKGFGSYTDKGAPIRDMFFVPGQANASIRIVNPKTAREVAPVMEYNREGEHISLPGTRYRLVDIQEQGVYSRKVGGYVPQYTFEEVE